MRQDHMRFIKRWLAVSSSGWRPACWFGQAAPNAEQDFVTLGRLLEQAADYDYGKSRACFLKSSGLCLASSAHPNSKRQAAA